jgi:hypothetical protein
MIKILPFIATAIMSASCHKEPYEVVIDWNWDNNMGWAPPKEDIKYYTDKKDVKSVKIHLFGRDGPDMPANSGGWRPRAFHKARDTLQTRIDIDPQKVCGMGTIYVHPDNGAHLPANYGESSPGGMSLEDSIWFTSNGWVVERFKYTK